MQADDRTTKAKIRDAAICEIADKPAGAPTVRDIAAAAGVSPGSVIHHYGSMDGLHQACNEHVAAAISAYKTEAVASQQGFDLLGAVRGIGDLPIAGYLAKAALGESPIVAQLIDDLVDDAVAYTEVGVEAGTVRPSPDPRARATVMMMWSLGGILLHQHFERLLGVDLTDPAAIASPDAEVYTRAALEIISSGMLTDAYAEQIGRSLDAAYGQTSTDSPNEDPEETP